MLLNTLKNSFEVNEAILRVGVARPLFFFMFFATPYFGWLTWQPLFSVHLSRRARLDWQ